MQIDKILLKTMFKEFWITTHNINCEFATIAFLKRLDLTNSEIKEWINISPSYIDMKIANNILNEAIKETENL